MPEPVPAVRGEHPLPKALGLSLGTPHFRALRNRRTASCPWESLGFVVKPTWNSLRLPMEHLCPSRSSSGLQPMGQTLDTGKDSSPVPECLVCFPVLSPGRRPRQAGTTPRVLLCMLGKVTVVAGMDRPRGRGLWGTGWR